jgi:hypothetical protein
MATCTSCLVLLTPSPPQCVHCYASMQLGVPSNHSYNCPTRTNVPRAQCGDCYTPPECTGCGASMWPGAPTYHSYNCNMSSGHVAHSGTVHQETTHTEAVHTEAVHTEAVHTEAVHTEDDDLPDLTPLKTLAHFSKLPQMLYGQYLAPTVQPMAYLTLMEEEEPEAKEDVGKDTEQPKVDDDVHTEPEDNMDEKEGGVVCLLCGSTHRTPTSMLCRCISVRTCTVCVRRMRRHGSSLCAFCRLPFRDPLTDGE